MITIAIGGMVPPSPNKLRRKYRSPHAYKQLRYQWEHGIYYMTSIRDRKFLKELALRGPMEVQITLYSSREYDPDNLQACQKPVLDALKNLQFIWDDSPDWLYLHPAKFQQMPAKLKKTEIQIGPLTKNIDY